MVDTLLKAVSGYNVQITDLILDYEDEDLKKFTFKENWDEQEPLLKSKLGDNYELVEILKQIYDWFMISKLLQGHSNISEGDDKYNNHNKDLR